MGTFRNLRNNIRFIRKLKTIRVNRELSLDEGEIQKKSTQITKNKTISNKSKQKSFKSYRQEREEKDAQNRKKDPTIALQIKRKEGSNSEERTHLLNFNEQRTKNNTRKQRTLSTGKINRNLKLTTGTIRKLLDYGKHEFNFPKLTYWKNKSKQ